MSAATPEPTTGAQSEQAPQSRETPIVILNPASNHGRAASLRRVIERELMGNRGELVLTQKPGDGTRIAEEAARAGRAVVVVGGDGAAHEAGNGVLRAGGAVPFGVVPAGSGNDYAQFVARMPLDISAALEIALSAPPERVDAGTVNDRYVLNALSVGIDANCSATAVRLKRYGLTGRALYMTAALREVIFNYGACPTLTTQFDDGPANRQVYAAVAMSIGPTYGGGFKINPAADPQDGMFDVCVLDKPRQLRALRLLPMVERGLHVGQPEAHFFHARRITLEATEEVYAQVDGELMRARRFEVALLPGAMWLRRGA
jgi:diacylglycerol kinase (ATP)